MAIKWPWTRARDAAPALPPIAANDNAQRGGLAMDGVVNVLRGMGTRNDGNATSFYAPIIPLNQVELENMYRGSWLPRRIVDVVAEDMTRAWISRTWNGHDTDKDGPRAIATAERRLNVRGNVTEANRWGGLFGGAGIVVGIKGQDPSTPLVMESIKQGDLEWLAVANRWFLTAATGDYLKIPHPIAEIGYPVYYNLTNVLGGTTESRVHWTRVIRFNGDKLPTVSWLANARWDDSRLQAPFNAIRRYDTTTSGVGGLIWAAKTDIISVDGLRDYLATTDGQTLLRERFDAVSDALSMFNTLLLDGGKAGVGGDKFDRKQIAFGGLNNIIVEMRNEVCGASHIPATKLWGQSPNGLNATGESDLTTWYDDIKASQESDLAPGLAYLDEILVRSTLGKLPDQYEFSFNPLWQTNEKEKAEIEKTRAERDKIYFDMGSISGGLVARTLHEERTYPPMQDRDVKLVEAIEAAPEPHDPKSGITDPLTPEDPPAAQDASARRALRAIAKDASQLQAFVFAKPEFDVERAAAWLKRNGKATVGPDENGESLRYSQEDPSAFKSGTFRTIQIAPGVTAVIGHPKAKNDGTDVVSRKDFQGFKIAVENPAGTLRHWKDADGNDRGTTSMRNDYGFFEDHLGSDGEELDAYLGPDETAKDIHVIRQMKRPDYEKFDENKVVLGATSAEHAKEIYLAHRDDGDQAFGGMTTLPMAIFKKKLKTRTGLGPIRA